MKLVLRIGISLMIMPTLSSCSLIYPYENKVACRLDGSTGKCISIEDAYEEAVTGVEKYKSLENGDHIREKQLVDSTKSSKKSNRNRGKGEYMGSLRMSYHETRLQEIAALIEEPVTPMLSPPKTIRTLFISYTNGTDTNTLYMPRYVYSIVEHSQFILGDYLSPRGNKKIPLGFEIE